MIATWLPFGSVNVPVVEEENWIVTMPRDAEAVAAVQLPVKVCPPLYSIIVPWKSVVDVIEPEVRYQIAVPAVSYM